MIFTRKYHNFLKSRRLSERDSCKNCRGKKVANKTRFTIEEVRSFVENNSTSELLSNEYTTVSEILSFKCECGNYFETTLNLFKGKNKRKCNRCSYKGGDLWRYKYEEVYDEFKKRGYELLSTSYTSVKEKLVAKTIDGYMIYTTFGNFLAGYTPNIFHKYNPYTIHNIKLWLNINNLNFTLESNKFKSSSSKLKWKCPQEHLFYRSSNNFSINRKCSICVSSIGENAIQKYLQSKNINYRKEYWFKDCKQKRRPLRFDFAILEDTKCMGLIEYDGEHHFQPVDYAGRGEEWAKDQFEISKTRDQIKNDYCKANNLPLLRIAYFEFDEIEDKLDEFLSKIMGGGHCVCP